MCNIRAGQNDAALRLRQHQFHGVEITDQIADITVNGTWQRQGHCSNYGVVFVISVTTGEVLDFVMKTLHCQLCSVKKCQLSDVGFSHQYKDHQSTCPINHQGASGKVEGEGANELFLRSIEKRPLRYKVYACEEKFEMDYFVVKKECVGHVQKRMGSRLMQLKKNFGKKKLDDGKGICVKGHLTQKEVDKIETNCGHAIRSNVGNQTAVKKSYNGSFITQSH